jgi:stage IV sporulation protein FB
MTWSFPVGRIFGSEIRIHATFFLLLLWIGLSAYLEGGARDAAINLAFILALFACVVAHEFGHALMARRYGIETPDITLLPIGGLARLDRMPDKPAQEIAVALAGPAVNVVIWAVLVFVFGANTPLDQLENIDDPGVGFFARLAAVNLFLVLFNMLPSFPMDGGRVFRAILSIPLGRVRATEVAARTGQIMAFGFGLLGLTGGSPILLLIAIFVFLAATAESSDVALRDMVRDVPARAAMITSFETLTPEDSLQAAGNSLLRTTQAEFPVVDAGGRPLGFLTRDAIFRAMSSDPAPHDVADVMQGDCPMVGLATPLEEVLTVLNQPGTPAVAVVNPAGALIGYVSRENIGEWIVVAGQRRR